MNMGLNYRPLDQKRNEIRLITLLGLTAHDSGPSALRQDLVECRLEYVSLDDYTPEYADFLSTDGASRSTRSRALLWSYVTGNREYFMRAALTREVGNIVRQTVATFEDDIKYLDTDKYNENTNRWMWGDFDALSYVWGDTNDTREVIINGHIVVVTKNLEEALRNLRGMHDVQERNRIWIDAICINQKDIDERNVQVTRMKDIYQDANTVYAWMGSGIEGSEPLAKLFHDIIKSQQMSQDQAARYYQAIPYLYDDSTWKGFATLMSRPYWYRLWIIQELGLANTEARLLWDNHECLLAAWFLIIGQFRVGDLQTFFLRKFSNYFSVGSQDSGKSPVFLQISTHLERLLLIDRIKYADIPYPPLMTLLDTGRNAQQKDERDKIYALVGLMDPVVQRGLNPNYGAPVDEIYQNFSRKVIETSGKLEIIYQGSPGNIEEQKLPSWVVDWSKPALDLSMSTFHSQSSMFHTAGDSKHHSKSDGHERHLVCRGFLFDTIDGLGCDRGCNPHPDHDIIHASASTTSTNAYQDDEGIRNALLETFTLGRLTKIAPHVLAHLRALPWFNRTAKDNPTTISYYTALDIFQQCNRTISIAGKSIEHYFPPWSEVFRVPPRDPAIRLALNDMMLPLSFKMLMTTQRGHVGFAPKMSREGDVIYVVEGSDVPLVLRRHGNGLYKLVGECYVHGIMTGEAMKGVHEFEEVVLC